MVPRPASPPVTLSEIQIFRPTAGLLNRTLGNGSRNPGFHKLPGDSAASNSLRTTAEKIAIFSN